MSALAKPGSAIVVEATEARQRCLNRSAAAFLVGLTIGAGLMQATAEAPRDMRVEASLIQLGTYLCKTYDGLQDITPIRRNRYTFRCHELAVFPNVEVQFK